MRIEARDAELLALCLGSPGHEQCSLPDVCSHGDLAQLVDGKVLACAGKGKYASNVLLAEAVVGDCVRGMAGSMSMSIFLVSLGWGPMVVVMMMLMMMTSRLAMNTVLVLRGACWNRLMRQKIDNNEHTARPKARYEPRSSKLRIVKVVEAQANNGHVKAKEASRVPEGHWVGVLGDAQVTVICRHFVLTEPLLVVQDGVALVPRTLSTYHAGHWGGREKKG